MVRRNLASYVDSFIFCPANGLDSTLRRDMCNVNVSPGFFCQDNVANDVDVLGKCGHSFQAQETAIPGLRA